MKTKNSFSKAKKTKIDLRNSENEIEKDENIEMVEEESNLIKFTKRNLPKEDEYEEFEKLICDNNDDEMDCIDADDNQENEKSLDLKQKDYLSVDEKEMQESLNEIYQDDNGKMVDVRKMYIKKRKGFLFWFFSFFLFALIVFGSGYYYYKNFYNQVSSDATAVDFSIISKPEVTAGEEFFYEIKYKNKINASINDVRIEVKYPDNFVFLESDPKSLPDKNSVWDLGTIENQHLGTIKIKGKLLGEKDKTSSLLANLSYVPENFSSDFKKETSVSSIIKDIGIDIDFDALSTALVGSENEINIQYRAKSNNFIKDFRLVFEPQENIKVLGLFVENKDGENVDDELEFETIRPGVWQINKISNETKNLIFKFDFLDKKEDQQKLVFNLEKKYDNDKYFVFLQEELEFEVMKSDLNLTMIINGSREDQGIDANGTLNYSIVYNNKGETAMQSVVVMAVLDSELLDWDSLQDKNGGIVSKNTITWTKEHIADFDSLSRHSEGTIDFAINVLDFEKLNVKDNKEYEIKSYAQFSVGKLAEVNDNVSDDLKNNNKSNTIVNKINSNLEFDEVIRYFNEDNIPVGTGPHPPEAGKKTTYRVYWDLSNSLNELDDLKIEVELPQNISWEGKEQVSVGSIIYDEVSKKVVWNVGRLPNSVSKINAYFDIGINPQEGDKDKIIILLPGTNVSAIDKETDSKINLSSKAGTSKLEGDEIASGDGVVK